jgi:hypothetical protein
VPVAAIGPNVAAGVTCTAEPPREATSLGQARRVPTAAGYVYGAANPPRARAEMDVPAIRAQITASTQPTVFRGNAEAFAVLRTDTMGQVYLRTMWPRNPA